MHVPQLCKRRFVQYSEGVLVFYRAMAAGYMRGLCTAVLAEHCYARYICVYT